MSEEAKREWDAKYKRGLPLLALPDPFFTASYESVIAPALSNAGLAVDLAGGLGRHALWLAQRKWRVILVELSDVAIATLWDNVSERAVDLVLLQAHAAETSFEPASANLIVCFTALIYVSFKQICRYQGRGCVHQ